jgi:hypothetical protein
MTVSIYTRKRSAQTRMVERVRMPARRAKTRRSAGAWLAEAGPKGARPHLTLAGLSGVPMFDLSIEPNSPDTLN